MKKGLLLTLALISLGSLVACGSEAKDKKAEATESKKITVVSREDGSGTRGAFIELFGIEEKGDDGSKKDLTTKEAVIANKTDVMLNNIKSDESAIGYVSLGSLGDNVKALSIDGVKATSENVKNKSYAIARPFMIATKGEAKGLAKDFIHYILSKEGQEVVSDSYIPVNEAAESFTGEKPEGKISIAGSSSVTPIMEKLKEAYLGLNPNAKIEIQMTDSTAGMTATMEGAADIGMASRDLKESELKELTSVPIALDGIAVVVNPKNKADNLTKEQVKNIFTGKISTWDETL